MSAEVATEYPKRPQFYAYKLTRLMFKVALANDIGAEACHLIIQIAHTEDAARYARAVTFYNEQLMPVCGFANVKALDRARQKAIDAGWLMYLPGGKSKAGRYWTIIPERYADYEDGSIDESAAADELRPRINEHNYLPATGKETGDKRETNGRQTPDKRATINPIPSPKEIYIPPTEINPDSHDGTLAEPEFIPVDSFAINPRVTAVEIGDDLVEYHEQPLQWEREFLRRWNSLSGVQIRPSSGLDPPLRRKLQQRLTDPSWFWKQAFATFPLKAEWFTSTQNLTWFLKPDTVSSILDGTYHQTEKPKGKHDRQGAGVNFDSNYKYPKKL